MIKSSIFLSLIFVLTGFTFVNQSESVDPSHGQQERWVAPEKAKTLKNKREANASSIANGKKVFEARCQVCHGATGAGDGPGAKDLDPKPATLASALVQDQVDGEIYWKISIGRGAMVKWGPILSKNDRWDLVNYIRTLKASE